MAYSIDADWRASGNTSGNLGAKLGLCVHHTAGTTIDMTGTFLANGTSAHYGVEPGHVRQFVEDRNSAWAAGHSGANVHLIHVECVNNAVGGDWPVAEGTVDTLVEFLADKCRERGWGRLAVGENLFGHRDFSATYCPGVLYDRLGEIARRVNETLDEGENDMTPEQSEMLAAIHNRVTRTDSQGHPVAQGHDLLGRVCMIQEQVGSVHNRVTRTDAAGHDNPDGHDIYGRVQIIERQVREMDGKLDAILEALDK